ncbi:F0F1 ATP synthase subunit gamma [Streptomyces laurentii]|uniref:ATP synthase gamma chain n=1 Tax=Streptomyces laurentii TaxID=39478 RepID=A0A160P4P7_STRLU|nr:ATP synthase gamma chain [Streptomyces laurentii]
MGAQLRVYKRRIKSVTATKKITKAMEMIAASRVVKAQRKVQSSTPYATELTRAVTAVATGANDKHALTTEADNPTRAAVLLLTSDRGLAGAFNSNAIKAAERLIKQLESEGKTVDIYVVGRRGIAHFNFRERKLADTWAGFTDEPTYADAKKIGAPLIEAIEKDTADGGVDELHIVYTEFVSMMTQSAIEARLLPLSLDEVAKEAGTTDTIRPLFDFEPSAEDVLDALLPRYVESRIYNALLQSSASKHAATRRAMKSATDNAGELITSLTRRANAARQAEITQEISEIVGGVAALADANAGSDK